MAHTQLTDVVAGDHELAKALAKEARIMAAQNGNTWSEDELLQEMWYGLVRKTSSDAAFLDENSLSFIIYYAKYTARNMVMADRRRTATLERNGGDLVPLDAPGLAEVTPSHRDPAVEALNRVALQEIAATLDEKARAAMVGILAGLDGQEIAKALDRSAAWIVNCARPRILAAADAYYAEV